MARGNSLFQNAGRGRTFVDRSEEVGVEIYPGFAGAEILTEGDRVIGDRDHYVVKALEGRM